MSEKRKDKKGRILRNGESQRTDGKYMFRYTGSDGKRYTVYSWKLVDTDKMPDGKRGCVALRDMEKQILKDLDDDIRTSDAESMSVNDLFDLFMELRTDLRETTRHNYTVLYNKHVRDVIGYRIIRTVRHTDIQKMYMSMIQDNGLKASTVQSVHSVVYQIFDNAVQDHILRVNPSANALKTLRKLINTEQEKRHALTEEEQARFIDFVYSNRTYGRWGPLFTVLLGTGMRIGEALGLRWCDCDFESNTISVNHILLYKESESKGTYEYRISEPKTTAGKRIIPMFKEVKETLLKLKERRKHPNWEPFVVDNYTDFIFLNNNGKVFTPGAVHGAIQNIVTIYNREEFFLAEEEHREPCYLPKFSAHILRHTFCTRMCENETNVKIVQDVMGHRNVTTTMDVYNEATASKKKASFENLEGKIKLS